MYSYIHTYIHALSGFYISSASVLLLFVTLSCPSSLLPASLPSTTSSTCSPLSPFFLSTSSPSSPSSSPPPPQKGYKAAQKPASHSPSPCPPLPSSALPCLVRPARKITPADPPLRPASRNSLSLSLSIPLPTPPPPSVDRPQHSRRLLPPLPCHPSSSPVPSWTEAPTASSSVHPASCTGRWRTRRHPHRSGYTFRAPCSR